MSTKYIGISRGRFLSNEQYAELLDVAKKCWPDQAAVTSDGGFFVSFSRAVGIADNGQERCDCKLLQVKYRDPANNNKITKLGTFWKKFNNTTGISEAVAKRPLSVDDAFIIDRCLDKIPADISPFQ